MTDDPARSRARQSLESAAAQAASAVTRFVNEGAGPVTGAAAYAEDRLSKFDGDAERAIRRIVNETTTATGATGFTTGVGGFVTLPAAIVANLAGSMLLNARMVGAIADLRGWSLEDETAQTAILLLAAGGSLNESLTAAGVKVGGHATMKLIETIPIEVIRSINKKAGFMLIAKYGTKRSVVTLAKVVPVVGGVVSGGVDVGFTRVVARAAKRAFPG
ncbi:MAG: hypothetical protein ACK5KK_01430 [Microbacterium sp.]